MNTLAIFHRDPGYSERSAVIGDKYHSRSGYFTVQTISNMFVFALTVMIYNCFCNRDSTLIFDSLCIRFGGGNSIKGFVPIKP